MDVLVVSDLHIHASNMAAPTTHADVILIAGDLSYHKSQIYEYFYKLGDHTPIIYVPGNHEYEGHNINTFDDELKELLYDLPYVSVLQNESIVIGDTKFIGSTLWTDFELYSHQHPISETMKLVQNSINEYSTILNDKKLLTAQKTKDLHEVAVKYLSYELKKNPYQGTTFVATHFLPHPESIDKSYENNLLNSYFCSNLEHLIGFSEFWVHGHTHKSKNYNKNGTNIICNPRGYSKLYNLSENIEFEPNLIIQTNEPKKY